MWPFTSSPPTLIDKLGKIEGFEDDLEKSDFENSGVSIELEQKETKKAASVKNDLASAQLPEERRAIFEKYYPNDNPDRLEELHNLSENGEFDLEEALIEYGRVTARARTEGRIQTAIAAAEADDDWDNLTEEQKEARKKAIREQAEKDEEAVESGDKTNESAEEDLKKYVEDELSKANTFVHQSYLFQKIHDINKVLKPTRLHKYSRVLVASGKNTSQNPLGTFRNISNAQKILNFSTTQLSLLVTTMILTYFLKTEPALV